MITIDRLLKKHCLAPLLSGWLTGLVLMLAIAVLSGPCYAEWNPSANTANNAVNRFNFINKAASIYTDNVWTQRKIPSLGQGVNFAPADNNNHYKVLKDGLYSITLTLEHPEGSGITNGASIQFYNKVGGWDNMHIKSSTPGGAGIRLLTVKTTAYLARNDYIRFLFKTTDNGNNNYPGYRNYRVAIIQLF